MKIHTRIIVSIYVPFSTKRNALSRLLLANVQVSYYISPPILQDTEITRSPVSRWLNCWSMNRSIGYLLVLIDSVDSYDTETSCADN